MSSHAYPFRVGMVGLGKQADDHLPALRASDDFNLVGVCDVNEERTRLVAGQYGVPGYATFEQMLEEQKLDVVMLTVPHHAYLEYIRMAAAKGIHVIKEKPFAVSMDEAKQMVEIQHKFGIYIGVTLQRRYNPVFTTFPQLRRQIGRVFMVEGKYTYNIKDLSQGWRASKELAGGGALIDMGYHFVDLLVWYFGLPSFVYARLSRGNRPGQNYDVEDMADINIDYPGLNSGERIIGNLIISRVYIRKEEFLLVHGTEGGILLERGQISRHDLDGNLIERLSREGGWPSAARDQLEAHGRRIVHHQLTVGNQLHEHLQHIAFIEAAYRSDLLNTPVSPADILREAGF